MWRIIVNCRGLCICQKGLPGIVSGTLLAFTMSIDDFIISFFTTGNGISNLSIIVYSMARRGIKPSINALSTIMFLSVLILLLLVNLLGSDRRKKVSQRKRGAK